MNKLWMLVACGLLVLAGVLWWPREGGDVPVGASNAARPSQVRPEAAEPVSRSREPAPEPIVEREAVAGPEAEFHAPAATVPLRVVTAESYGRNAARIPELAFEVLSLTPSTGPVPSQEETSLAALLSGGSTTVRHDAEPLLVGRTDSDGEALVEVPVVAGEVMADPPFLVRLVAPGYQQRRGRVRAPKAAGDPYRTLVLAARGATARGRCVDELGNGVDAKVRAYTWVAHSGARQLGFSLTGSRGLADGWFELDYHRDAPDLALIADGGEHGTGALAALSLRLDDPPRDLAITVTGPGRLTGRVLDAEGSPAEGAELLVCYAKFDDEEGNVVSPEPLASQVRVEGGGRLWHTLETDAEGGFDVRGLRATPYVVRARTGQDADEYPLLLTASPVIPDGTPLELRLAARPYLAVRLTDADGSPWTAEVEGIGTKSAWDDVATDRWPETPRILVHACTPAGERPLALGAPLEGRMTGHAEGVVEVPDDARYLVTALGGGFRGAVQLVDVLPGAGRVPVELRAPERCELGRLSVRVLNRGALLEPPGFGGPGFDVLVEDLETGTVLVRSKEFRETSPILFDVPAGRYRVVAEGSASIDSHHGTLMAERGYGRTEAEVDVLAGKTRELDLELGGGVRLSLALEGQAREADRDAVRAWDAYYRRPENAEWMEKYASCATIELLRPDRRPETVYTTYEVTGSSAAGTHRTWFWPLGEDNMSQVVPPGAYTLVARLPGGREVREEVVLVVGETQSLTLRF